MTYLMFGKHAVMSALANKKRKIHKIYSNKKLDIKHNSLKILDKNELDKLLPGQLHQNIIAEVEPLEQFELNPKPLADEKIVILDQVSDPQNLGAIIRNAAAFNIKTIIIPDDNSPRENGVIAKAACGTLEQVKLVRVKNIARTIKKLKEQQYWVIGLSGHTKQLVNSKILQGKTAIILGSEGKGMRDLTMKNCDIICKIPISSEVESINVASAASIVFYLASL